MRCSCRTGLSPSAPHVAQEEVCSGWAVAPARLLSFGCSVGIELEEALARFPQAQAVGYDLDPEVLRLARRRFGTLELVSDYDRLPARGFDLILAPLASTAYYIKDSPQEYVATSYQQYIDHF